MRKEESKIQDPTEDLQAELLRLQRQFRLLEDDRGTYREETEYSLQKQRETIKVLNEELSELMKDNKLAGGTKVQNFDAENTEKLKYLLEDERYAKLSFNDHQLKLESVDQDIKNLRTLSDVQRKRMGGVKESERKTKEMHKMVMVMENRLNEANKKFNNALAENNKMRQEIDHINIQRRKFEETYKKLSSLFKSKKKEKDILIETSTSLFNARDEAHNRMQTLREKSERDITQYSAELKDLLRVIDHDKKLRDFMSTKTEERAEMYEASIQGRKEKKLRDYVKTLQGKVENYDEIFGRLIEVSGNEDVDEMIKKFIRVEDENFASFNYIKEQTQQIQEKEASISKFKQQIKKMNVDEAVVDSERKQISDNLMQEEVNATADYLKLTTTVKDQQEKLDKVSERVESLFDRIQCNRGAQNNLLCGSKINNSNLISWIGLIEQRACELMQAKCLMNSKKKLEGIPENIETNHLKFNTLGKVVHCMIAPPSLHSDTAMADMTATPAEQPRPLSQQETRAIVQNNFLKAVEKDKKNGELAAKKVQQVIL